MVKNNFFKYTKLSFYVMAIFISNNYTIKKNYNMFLCSVPNAIYLKLYFPRIYFFLSNRLKLVTIRKYNIFE